MEERGETRGELIGLARENGYEVTGEQLARWHRRGLLPTPLQAHKGKGRGTESVYPAGTGERLLALCEAHLAGGEKRLDRVAWRLWWDGFDVSMGPVREVLAAVAEQVDAMVAELSEPDGGGLSDAAFEEIERVADPSARLSREMGAARRRVGTGEFDVFMGAVLRIATGTFEGLGADDDPQTAIDRRALERGLGLRRARTDSIGGSPAWLPDDWADDGLADMSRFVGAVRWGEELAGLSDEQLRESRDAVRPWIEMVAGYALIAEQTLGRGAMGISVIGEALGGAGPDEQAYLVLLWAVARSKGPVGLREGLEANGAVDPEWRDGLDAWGLLEDLRREVPAIAEAVTPREFGAALQDPRRMEQLEGRLAELRERHAEEIDAFFRAHPEYGYESE